MSYTVNQVRRPAGCTNRRPMAVAGALLLAVVPALGWTAWSGTSGAHMAAAAPATDSPTVASVYRPIGPCRLADTRHDLGIVMVAPGVARVVVAGRCGVPAGASAAALTVTVTDTRALGHLTVFPAGEQLPTASNVNWRAGETRANSVLARLGAGGAIDIHVSTATEVVVDVTGAFEQSDAARAGRFTSIGPTRVLDTRQSRAVAARSVTRVARPLGVPADAVALAVNVTATDTAGWGYFTAYPAGGVMPVASVLNVDASGQTRAASAIVPITANGFDIFSWAGAHVIVDVTGWFTGASAAVSSDGRFVATSPSRVLDTRQGLGALDASGAATVPPPADAAALAATWTVVGAAADDHWVSVRPAGAAPTATSALNATIGEEVANTAITPMSGDGVTAVSFRGSHLIADVQGWFTGAPAAGLAAGDLSPFGIVRPGPRGGLGAPWRVLYVGDSLAFDTVDVIRSALPGIQVDSVSYGGVAPCDLIPEWVVPALAATPPDLVLFSFLGNNGTACAGGRQGEALLDDYWDDLTQLCALAAPAPCVAVGQPPLGPAVERNLPAPDEPTTMYRDAADDGWWGFVDAGRAVEQPDGSYDPQYRQGDGVHLNAAGAARYGAVLAAYLRAILG